MKTLLKLTFFAFLIIVQASCNSSDEMEPVAPVAPGMISGTYDILLSGPLTAQSSTNTKGKIQVVRDKAANHFVRLTEDFNSKFSTGTVTVYLSTSSTLNLSSPASFQLVSVVGKSGEHFFVLPGVPDAKFTHGIIWCGAAAIPFGFAPLN